ncbi:hypothetical protein [Kitasatospora sp. NPDC085879]|uniref:hypothetical protein n=1 Tax=Kitasatospora sp. NPDC085879 TaxID=3154769 RepID=UPI000BB1617D|nr:hypothetical protein [Streptomyces sp. TLI_235]PBC69856.1 hypothetical protein BX265_7216 [Streptomyces sp. TLI_235]
MRANEREPDITVENVIWAAAIVCLIAMWAISATTHLEPHPMPAGRPTAGSTATDHPGGSTDGRPAPTDYPH